jgi:hypothetical protein
VIFATILAWFSGPVLIKDAAEKAIGESLVKEAKANAEKIEGLRGQLELYVNESKSLLDGLKPPYNNMKSEIALGLTTNSDFTTRLKGDPGTKVNQ